MATPSHSSVYFAIAARAAEDALSSLRVGDDGDALELASLLADPGVSAWVFVPLLAYWERLRERRLCPSFVEQSFLVTRRTPARVRPSKDFQRWIG